MSDDKSIVPSNENKRSAPVVQTFENKIVDAQQLQAINTLANKKIPPEKIKTRPGGKGKGFQYVAHTWVTRTLQEGLGNMWSFEVLDWEVIREKLIVEKKPKDSVNIAARCSMTLWVMIDDQYRTHENDPLFIKRVVTEIGAYDKQMASMPTAMAIASAVSRGICKCAMRMFGIGLEFYESDDDISPESAWTALREFAVRQGANWDTEFKDTFAKEWKAKGYKREDLVNHFTDAYAVVAKMLGKTVEEEEVPFE